MELETGFFLENLLDQIRLINLETGFLSARHFCQWINRRNPVSLGRVFWNYRFSWNCWLTRPYINSLDLTGHDITFSYPGQRRILAKVL
jgi:hypothetical protein